MTKTTLPIAGQDTPSKLQGLKTLGSKPQRLARHLSCWALLLTLVANVATAREPGANEVRLDSLEVSNITFKTPIHRSDSQGKQQGYEEGVLLLVKGDFPPYRAEPFELFIGDYQIKEYSGTQEEIQIIFFEAGLVDRLEGQEWRYRSPHGELQSLGVAFGRSGLRALSTAPAPKNSSP